MIAEKRMIWLMADVVRAGKVQLDGGPIQPAEQWIILFPEEA
jgi:hypothetical protein